MWERKKVLFGNPGSFTLRSLRLKVIQGTDCGSFEYAN